MASTSHVLCFVALVSLLCCLVTADNQNNAVTYDGRSIMINGRREIFFSGSIHYPRSTPDVWPSLIKKAKEGGLNVIQTYVFWNIHEPEMDKYDFSGPYDVIKFFKIIAENGMYATVRLGPFIQAEWNHGGLPYWLREVPGIIFRSYNQPYLQHMEKFVTKVINMMKEEKLFASQGGPIILAQIENEYNTVQRAYRNLGDKYVQWAGNFAQGLNVGVPWVMCKQTDAPDPVINACNGRHCADTFQGPNRPNKPSLWTENWTAQFRVFGDPPSQRSAEDLAYSVAKWFASNGTLVNYYMFHGGTNFGRTAASFVTTRYYDEAPLDEFGLYRQPKFGHLRDMHRALQLCRKALFKGDYFIQKIGSVSEARYYEKPGTDICSAFLINNDTRTAENVKFRGQEYHLEARSISILPDCKTVVFNTDTIVTQHNARNFVKSKKANQFSWEMYSETIPYDIKPTSREPAELYRLTKDKTDYAWYSTKVDLNPRDFSIRKDIEPVLRVASMGHAMLAFVNQEFIGSAHGSQIDKNFVLQQSMTMKPGVNYITLLGTLIGLPDSGAYMEHRYAGPRGVSILGMNTGTLDLTVNGWGMQVGLAGEQNEVFTESGAKKVKWQKVPDGGGPCLTWYKSNFETPDGKGPVAIRMNGMTKGMIWVNGQSIGRYWMSYLSPLKQPTQSEYHIPRSYLKPSGNLLVILEEEPSDPKNIEILTVNRDTLCTIVTEYHTPGVMAWSVKDDKLIGPNTDQKPTGRLDCGTKKIESIDFVSYGDPGGACGSFGVGKCDAPDSKPIIEQLCVGKTSCDIPLDKGLFEKKGDPCPGVSKQLAVQASCGKKSYVPTV